MFDPTIRGTGSCGFSRDVHRAAIAVLLLPAVFCAVSPVAVAAAEPAHPYLFFSAQDLPALRARMEREPFATRWRGFLAHAERCLGQDTPRPGQAVSRSRYSLGVAGTTAFAYAVTGDRRFGVRARDELLALLQSDGWHVSRSWNRGADLDTAELSVAAALVYDWCHDLLDERQRRAIREGVLEKSVQVYLHSVEEAHDWWVDNPVTNWCGVCHGGCGLAALALYHESPEAARAADLSRDHVRRFLRSVILTDGGGHEGVMYWRYGVTFGNYMATAAAQFYGEDGLCEEYTRKMAGYWDIYMQAPDLRYANFNDMSERTFSGLYGEDHRALEGGPRSCLCALFESAVPGGDPLLLWGADRGADKFYWRGTSPFYFLWRRDAPPAGPKPPLQDAVLFRGAGHAIFQSPQLWFAYNGGWTSNRSHFNRDLGTFVLVAAGERFVSDPGYGANRTRDHSTVLANGKGQPRGVGARYRRFGQGEGFAYLASDLSECYPDSGLTRFVRHVLMVDGRYLVLLDDLEANAPSAFEWRLQSRLPAEAHSDSRRATIHGSAADLHVVAAAPADARLRAESADVPLKRGRTRMQMLRISPDSPVRRTAIVTVLYPTPSDAAPPQVSFHRGTLTVSGEAGEDTVMFEPSGGEWRLKTVNGEDASSLPTGEERTLERVSGRMDR